MDGVQKRPAEKVIKPRSLLSRNAVTTILWESAWNALFRAFIIQILGSIAISLLGEVFKEMSPSLPPGLNRKPHEGVEASPISHWLGTFIAQNQFWIIFGVLFLALTATRFALFLRDPELRRFAARFLRINRRISGHWFSLFVLNGLLAWISTTVFIALHQFSWTQILWGMISPVLQPLLHMLANLVPGAGAFERWYSWYGENQAKFVF
jgi:hypothetical protein